MKLNNTILLGLAISLMPAVSAYPQLIRYVSYYPVPAVTHSQLSVTGKTVLGGIAGANIEIGADGISSGAVVGQSFQANRVALTAFNNSASSQNLIVGHISNNNTSNAGIIKAGANVSVVENLPALATIEATGNLSLAGLYWPGKGGIGLNKDGTEDWENCPEGSELNWVKLRLGGSDDFRTYLVCGAPEVKEAPQCDPAIYQCSASEDLVGNPVMGTCRCVEDCKKRTDGKSNLTEGGLCCKPGQISKDGPYGKFCTFPFREQGKYVNAIADTECYPAGNACNNATRCNVKTATIKYYVGGSVKTVGSNDVAYKCGSTGKLCSSRYSAYNRPHKDGWTGGTEIKTICPEVTGMSTCDALCDIDNENCRYSEAERYCIKKNTTPSIPNGSLYEYKSCRTIDKSGCNGREWIYNGKLCGDSYTSSAQIVYCSK